MRKGGGEDIFHARYWLLKMNQKKDVEGRVEATSKAPTQLKKMNKTVDIAGT